LRGNVSNSAGTTPGTVGMTLTWPITRITPARASASP